MSIVRKVALVVLAAALVIGNGQAAQAAMLDDKQSEEIVRRYAAFHIIVACARKEAFKPSVPADRMNDPGWYVVSNKTAVSAEESSINAALGFKGSEERLMCNEGMHQAKNILAPSSSTSDFMKSLGYIADSAADVMRRSKTKEEMVQSALSTYGRSNWPTALSPGIGFLLPNNINKADFLPEDARYWMAQQFLNKKCKTFEKTSEFADPEKASSVTFFRDNTLVTEQYQDVKSSAHTTLPCEVADAVSTAATNLSAKYNRELTNAKKDAILTPLLDGMCSGDATDPTDSSRQDCRRKYREAFNACYVARTPGPAAGPRPNLDGAPILPTAEELAKCIARRAGGNMNNIKQLIDKGLEASASVSISAGNITGDSTAATTDGGGESQSSCNISGGMGWLICPAISLLATISDAAFGIVSNHLTIAPKMLSTEKGNDGAYQAWSAVRTIANAGFVIIFLVVIFSHLTGAGGGRP